MAGFFGSFSLDETLNPDFWEDPQLFPTINKIRNTNLEISHFTNTKFSKDKVFKESEFSITGLDGVILNKTELIDNYGANSWESLLHTNLKNSFKSFLNSLRGEFNGFYFDKVEKKLFIYTNHCGTKPIFYSYINQTLYFSSDYLQLIRSLKKLKKLQFDHLSIEELLRQGYINENRTHFEGVFRLQAGQYLICDTSIIIKKYKDWNDVNFNSFSIKKNLGEFNDYFKKAISLEYQKDIEYDYRHVCTLSGGLDSRANVLVAEKLGFRSKLHLCTSQNDYLDIQIAREIVNDLNEELKFNALDEIEHLLNIDENIAINGALVAYNGSAHILELYKKYYPENGGLVHSGQIGDGIFHSFVKVHEAENPVNDGYKNYETKSLYNKAFNSVNNGHWTTESFTYLTSPFMNVDVLDFVLSIPHNQRKNSGFYLQWINDYLPEAKKYKWEKINLRPTKFNHKIGLVLNRFRIGLMNKISGHDLNRSMNPYKYWYSKQDTLAQFLDNVYQDHNSQEVIDVELYKIINRRYKMGSIAQKFNVISFLRMIGIWQNHD